MENHSHDGVDRRGFLRCMAWAGTGVLWAVKGGILTGCSLQPTNSPKDATSNADFTFAQLSDSHIGFAKEPNQNVVGTMQEAIRRINAGPAPALLLHTGDLTHLSKPEEFDTVDQLVRTVKTERAFYVPGSMMCLPTMANRTLTAMAKTHVAMAGKVLTTRACISSGW